MRFRPYSSNTILQTQVKLPSMGEKSINPSLNKTEISSIDTQARRGIEKDLKMN